MKFIKRKLVALLLAVTMLGICIPASQAFANTSGGTSNKMEIPLLAGQNKNVGTVVVERKGTNELLATYTLNEKATKEGWLIYEAHLAIGHTKSELPQNRSGNPVPGQFPYKKTFQEGKQTCSMRIDISGYRVNTLYLAAHATVKKVTSATTVKAPYGGSKVYAYKQGLRSDGNVIDVYRSDPNNALHYESGISVSNFYSLGFEVDKNSGWIIIEFDKPIINGQGNDIDIVEDTWVSPYVEEYADVYVSNNGRCWKYLGRASNLNKYNDQNSSTKFDLSSVGMSSAKYVKLQDVSSNEEVTDGFDLNAVLALHDFIYTKTEEESAWASGTRFVSCGNWGMYFTFKIDNVVAKSQCFSLLQLLFFWLR